MADYADRIAQRAHDRGNRWSLAASSQWNAASNYRGDARRDTTIATRPSQARTPRGQAAAVARRAAAAARAAASVARAEAAAARARTLGDNMRLNYDVASRARSPNGAAQINQRVTARHNARIAAATGLPRPVANVAGAVARNPVRTLTRGGLVAGGAALLANTYANMSAERRAALLSNGATVAAGAAGVALGNAMLRRSRNGFELGLSRFQRGTSRLAMILGGIGLAGGVLAHALDTPENRERRRIMAGDAPVADDPTPAAPAAPAVRQSYTTQDGRTVEGTPAQVEAWRRGRR